MRGPEDMCPAVVRRPAPQKQPADLGFLSWGGVDSNHRRTDYESANREGADLQQLLNVLVRSIPMSISVPTHWHRFVYGLRPFCGFRMYADSASILLR